MKLYKFTFNDNQNLSLKAIQKLLKDTLNEEAQLQGWKSGYKLKLVSKNPKIINNEKEYEFAVYGKLLDIF